MTLAPDKLVTFSTRRAQSEARIAYICVNGILSRPGDSDGWTDRAVTWLNLHTAGKAEKFEYASGALTRRIRQQARAVAITKMIGYYCAADFTCVLIGHSNGCDLIARVLDLTGHSIRAVHLFAAAADFDSFASALKLGKLGALHLYESGDDGALKLAGLSRKFLGFVGLGYGTLGAGGQIPQTWAHDPRIRVYRQEKYGHSTWFQRGATFERTMSRLIENEFSERPIQ